MTDIVNQLLDEKFIGQEGMRRVAASEILRLRAALSPFAETAERLGWDKLLDDDMSLGDHVVEAPADDIAPGAFYCLMIMAFREAAAALHIHEGRE